MKGLSVIIGSILLWSQIVSAQSTSSVSVSITLPSIALLDIEPNNSVFTLALSNPNEAGDAPNSPTNSSKWLNFTSAVAPSLTRRVTAQMTGTLPTGVSLRLNTATYAGVGAGTLGTVVSPIYLSASPQTIINGIGGAFTGTGANNGFNLSFTPEISDFSMLRTQSATVSIIYTLTDN
jgi:hypothetical protein